MQKSASAMKADAAESTCMYYGETILSTLRERNCGRMIACEAHFVEGSYLDCYASHASICKF